VLADASDESVMHALFEQHHFVGVLHLAALVSVPESFREPALNYSAPMQVVEFLNTSLLFQS
jgi:UDP-glucose 4-epimerase